LLLGYVIDSYFSRAARTNAVSSERYQLRTPVPNPPDSDAAARSPADRIRDTFEHFPGSRRPVIKPKSNRGDWIMFG
jgi:hypothetical protein